MPFTLIGANTTVSYISGFSLPHKTLCTQMGLEPRLLILVASSLNNAPQRDAIRFSWGHYARSCHAVVAFVLGAPESHMLNVLAAEDALYGDLIIGNSDDSYAVFKMASMLYWTNAYCLNAPRLFTINDRVFTNVMNLLNLTEAPEHAKAKLTVWGDFVISNNEIRSSDVYLFTNDTIATLLPKLGNITSDDKVLLSANQGYEIHRYNVPNFINNLQQPCNIKLHVACHIFLHYQHYELWLSIIEGQNSTRNFYNRANVSIGLSKSLRPIKPDRNTGIIILLLLFLLLCIF